MAEQFSGRKQSPHLEMVIANDGPPPRPGGRPLPTVRFNYAELQLILNVYGRQVAEGAWRDYAMDFLKDRALFSIYRNHSERPLYVIEKDPRLRDRQGQYLVIGQNGRVLKRGHDLAAVLRLFEPGLSLVK